jgi:hypothetical protein
LLCVADNLEEDVDVCRELVFERLSTHDWEIVTLVTQGRQLLNGRRVWHPARVVFLLLTRFVSVVYTVAVPMAETAFARSRIL